jgi:flagellar basal body-associated protein FliL
MSNPEQDNKPEEAEGAEEQQAAPAPAAGGGFVFRAFIVAAITFVVVIAMAVALYMFVIPRPATLDAASIETGSEEPIESGEGGSVVKDLITDGEFTTVVGPDARRSVTYRYDICVKVTADGAERLEEFLDPKKKNMLPKVTERIRQIINSEQYTKLQVERLEDVKRRIKNALNGMLGQDVVEEVIFKTWSIFM